MIVYDIQKLTKFYPGQTEAANKEISLQIRQGEIFGMLGDNGAGKSTIAALVGFTAVSFVVVGRSLQWRRQE